MTPLERTIFLLVAADVPIETIGVKAIKELLARGETPEDIVAKAGAKPARKRES